MFNTASNSFETRVITITPATAKYILDFYNTKNRSISVTLVNKYCRDILNGDWMLTNQGIGFYKNGVLADGQHRLSAIVAANTPVAMLVTFGLERDAVNGIDQHRARSVSDVLTIKGGRGYVSNTDVATIRLTITTPKVTLASIEHVFDMLCAHLANVNMWFPKHSKLCSAPVRASLVLALFNGVDKAKLAEFVQILVTGITSDAGHGYILQIRDELLMHGVKGGDSERRQFMKRFMVVINLFVRGETRKRIATPSDFLYPQIKLNGVAE